MSRWPLLLVVALAMAAVALPSASATHAGNVHVAGDAGFDTATWSGTGTAMDPFRLRVLSVPASGGYAVELSGTTKHVNLSGLSIAAGGASSDGIHIYTASNVTIHGSAIESSRIGIHVRSSTNVTISGTTVKTSQVGVLLESTRGARVNDSRIQLNDKNVQLRGSVENVFARNNVSIATGQFGFYFDDNTSYANTIDTSNVVNAVPIRWYTDLAGTPAAPLVIPSFTMDLPRITNVAQIMLHNVSHARLDAPIAKAGASSGIHIHAGRDIELTAPIAEGNAAAGVFVELSSGVRIGNASVRNNTASGIVVRSSDDTNVSWSAATGNGQSGLVVDAWSNRTRLDNLTVASNAAGGVRADRARNLTLISLSVTASGPAGVTLANSFDVTLLNSSLSGPGGTGVSIASTSPRVAGNLIRDHATAISLVGVTGANFTNNEILLGKGGTGFQFDGPASYDNGIAPSNTVNGTAVRWYTRVVEPVTLPDLRVEVPGITNVAQIMLYRTSNVSLTNLIAKNGSAVGVVLHESADTHISNATVSSNAAQGFLATAGTGFRLSGSVSSANGVEGVRLAGALGTTIENTRVSSNGGRGLAFDGGDGATLRGNVVIQNAGAGIHLDRVGASASAVENSVLDRNAGGGIIVNGGVLGSLRANTLTSNGANGIVLSGVAVGARLDQNVLSGHARAITLTSASGTEIVTNNITIVPGETGVHFSDEVSYNVTAPPSNLVNGVPLRWYVGTRNVTIEDPIVRVPGITNVAQIMLYKVANVTVARGVAENGSASGVHVLRSDNVTLDGGRTSGNAGVGVRVEFSPDARLNTTQVLEGLGDGVLLASSVRANANGVFIDQNRGRGIAIDASANVSVRNATIARNQGGIVATTAAGLVLQTNRVEHNGAAGVTLSGASYANLSGNIVENHTRGFEIAGTTKLRPWNNTVTIAEDQTGWHISDTASYDSTIGPSNLVNGVAMRWYSREVGVNLTGSRVELRGITNVAQIMLHHVDGTTLDGVVAANGSARGIYIVNSAGARVSRALVENNSGDGIDASALSVVDISNSTFRTNGAAAIKGVGARLRIDNVTASEGRGVGITVSGGTLELNASSVTKNAGAGVTTTAAASVAVARSTFNENRGAGISVSSGGSLNILSSDVRDNAGAGISATTVGPVNVSFSAVSGNTGDGIALIRSSTLSIYDNRVGANGGAGVRIDSGLGARVAGNRLEDQPRGIEIRDTEYGEFHANTIRVLPDQIGIHFADERSYTNTIPTTNTVNGAPIHWYTMLAGSEAERVVLEGIRSDVRGATNIAQIMIHRSAYVDLKDATATNATSRGIYLYASSAIRVTGSNVTNATLHGVQLQATQSSTVSNLTARDGGSAVRLTDSANNVVTNVDARGATAGVVFADTASRDNRVEGVRVNGTARGVTDPGWNGLGLLGNNLVVDAGVAKRAKVGAVLSLDDAMVSYRLDSSRIVEQSWAWGDGTPPVASAASALHRPSRSFDAPGSYVANLTVRTADGLNLTDSVEIEIVPPLSAPRTLAALPGARNITLTWTPPLHDGAAAITKYRIYRGGIGVAPSFITEVTGSTQQYVDTGLENGRPYLYDLSAVNGDGEGPRASAAAIPIAAPSAPTSLRAEAAPRAVVLSWDAPGDPGGLPVGSYQVLRGTNGSAMGVVASLGNVTTYTDAGLANGVPYTHAVRAVNGLGPGPATANATTTPVGPPAPPTGVRAAGADAAALVVWTPPADTGGLPILGYRVWRAAPNGTLVALPGTLAANATSARESGLSNGQVYSFAVSAINSRGEGEVSLLANATPSAIDSLAPVIYGETPARGAFVTEVPLVRVRYADNVGVNALTGRLFLDDVELNATVDAQGAEHTLVEPLARGHHTVRVVVRDMSGNEANESWTFRVITQDEKQPVFEQEGLALSVNETEPGGNVTARVRIRNVGLEAGALLVSVRLADNALAHAEVTLDAGEERDIALEFSAPLVLGEYELEVANATVALLVRAPLTAETEDGTPADAEPDAPAGPVRPVRGTPPPRPEPKETPLGPLVGLLAVIFVARLRKRR